MSIEDMWSFWSASRRCACWGPASHGGDRLRARDIPRGDLLFKQGDDADSGFVVQRGAFRIADGAGAETTVAGHLIGELRWCSMKPAGERERRGIFLVIRIARACFSACWKAIPPRRFRLRDEFAVRSSQIASDI